MAKLYVCDNCRAIRERDDLPYAKDILQRIDPGGIFTDKECDACGALSYPIRTLADPVAIPEHIALTKQGEHCPFCEGIMTSGGPVETGMGEARQEMSCLDCDSEWIEVYELVNVEVKSCG